MSRSQKIAIIGAGIGGLTTALALRQRGFDICIYEQSRELAEVGAGLTISPSAALVFESLSLQSRFEALEPPLPSIGTLHWRTGVRLAYEKRDLGAYLDRFGALTRQVHRADLHRMLVTALGSGSVELGKCLTDIAEDCAGVLLKFAGGETARADVVIACDGLKSVVRSQVFSDAKPQFTGFVAWRGLVDGRALSGINRDPHFATYPSEEKLFVRYPVRRGSLINYVAIARKPDFTAEGWRIKADPAEVLAEFTGWHEDVRQIIAATPPDQCMCWALYTRPLLDSWTTKRIGLLGDAAHPMTPFFGMGANMAIEDGLVLARCFDTEPEDLSTGLTRYEKARLARGNMMQQISLERAGAYMNPDPAQRNQGPTAGMKGMNLYDPRTVPV